MSSSRKFGSPWLLLLVLVCSLLGRPLHDAWHIAHPLDQPDSVTTTVSQNAVQDSDRDDGDGDDGVKADACAWCLFHAQAMASGRAPDALLNHAEADAPPAVLSREPLRSLVWTVAKPRGPPSA